MQPPRVGRHHRAAMGAVGVALLTAACAGPASVPPLADPAVGEQTAQLRAVSAWLDERAAQAPFGGGTGQAARSVLAPLAPPVVAPGPAVAPAPEPVAGVAAPVDVPAAPPEIAPVEAAPDLAAADVAPPAAAAAPPVAIVPAPTAGPHEPSDGPTLPPQLGLRTNPLRLPQLPAGTLLDGLASWYGPGFHGNTTACGPIYDQNAPVLASRELRCGTIVRVTGPYGVSTEAMAIDWGPVEWAGRRFDLSAATFAAIAPLGRGVVPVRIEVLGVAA